MTILCVKLFLEKHRIVEFESVWSFAESMRNGDSNTTQVSAHDFLGGPLRYLFFESSEVGILSLHHASDLCEMVLQIVNIDIDGEEGVRRDDCFNF